MISLLINAPDTDDGASSATRFGGKPSAPRGVFSWPVCKTCKGNMQFLGQLQLRNQGGKQSLLLLFMCQNDPGLCDDWDADAGGNAVIPVDSEALELVERPSDGETIRPVRYGATIAAVEARNYEHARELWIASASDRARDVLGQMGGQPSWIQSEEVPSCDACGASMSFVAQLEEGPDHKTAMNFGGGCAYVYHCCCGTHSAKMLWQC